MIHPAQNSGKNFALGVMQVVSMYVMKAFACPLSSVFISSTISVGSEYRLYTCTNCQHLSASAKFLTNCLPIMKLAESMDNIGDNNYNQYI